MMQSNPHSRIGSRRSLLVLGLSIMTGFLSFTSTAYAKRGFDFMAGKYPKDWDKGTACSQWNLGPLGVFGYEESRYNKQWTVRKRFLIREVVPGTPADGKLKQHDIILGVVSPLGAQTELDALPGMEDLEPGPTNRDYICRSLGRAITEAQQKENGGKLVLKVWRPETEPADLPEGAVGYREGRLPPASWSVLKQPITGEEIEVALTIPVTGAFSEQAPWECEKTDAIIDRQAQAILQRGLGGARAHPITQSLDALGLLATGEKKYLPAVRELARATAKKYEGLDIAEMNPATFGTWVHAYQNLFLAEYYLATKDEEVLRGLTDLSVVMAKGRSGVGTYSHTLSYTKYFGLYGPAAVYGAMNQCSITANMALALAQKAGIKSKAIDDAVAIATEYLLWYVDAGSIDYGNADAWPFHDDNGKNSQAAVFFDIVGHERATEYFTRTTLASYMDRVQGHTGHFFNSVWGALGAARGGPEAAAAFAENTRWYTTLERRWNGDAFFNGPGKYKDFSTAGAHLLHHCLPRRAIYLTGKGGSSIQALSSAQVRESVDAARFDPYDKELSHARTLTTSQLLEKLGSFSPVVRRQAALVLNQREVDVVKELIAMLNSPNRYARYGACIGLHCAGRQSDEAAQALLRILGDEKEELTLRYFAMKALGHGGNNLTLPNPENGLGIARNKLGADILELVAKYQSDGVVSPETYLQDKLYQNIANVGFKNTFIGEITKDDLDKVSRSLLEAALRSVLANPLQDAHDTAMQCLMAMDQAEQEAFLPDVYRLAKTPSPAVNGKSRPFAIEVLAKFQIREAMPLAEALMDEETNGRFWRRPLAIRILSNYGPDVLKPYMDKIEKYYEEYIDDGPKYERNMLKTAMQKIEEKRGQTTEVRSIEPYLKEARLKHGATAYCLRAKAGDGGSIRLTWLKGRTMPTSGLVFRNGKEIATVDPAALLYVDEDAPPGEVEYRVEFTLPQGKTYSLEASFPGRPEDFTGELGVLDMVHGFNPVSKTNWRLGDTYRLVFVSSETTEVASKDFAVYDKFVTELAKEAGIGGSWKILNNKDHTQTEPGPWKVPGTIPVILIDGKTKIADNYRDLWDNDIDAPINTTETGEVLEEGLVFTGGRNVGDLTAYYEKWKWINSGNRDPNETYRVYAISDVLKVKSKN